MKSNILLISCIAACSVEFELKPEIQIVFHREDYFVKDTCSLLYISLSNSLEKHGSTDIVL